MKIIHLQGDPNKERFEVERVKDGWRVQSWFLTTGYKIFGVNKLRLRIYGTITDEKLKEMIELTND